MAALAAIRTATKTTISAAVSSLFGYDHVADVVNLPAFVVEPTTSDFVVAMGRGVDTHNFNIYVLVSSREAALAQAELDKYVTGAGVDSVRQAVWNARTLGLAETTAAITGMNGYGGSFEYAGIDHVGAILTMVVHTGGTA